METLELPVAEESEVETPPATCMEEAIDLAAFELWRQASVPEASDEPV